MISSYKEKTCDTAQIGCSTAPHFKFHEASFSTTSSGISIWREALLRNDIAESHHLAHCGAGSSMVPETVSTSTTLSLYQTSTSRHFPSPSSKKSFGSSLIYFSLFHDFSISLIYFEKRHIYPRYTNKNGET